MCSRRPQAGVKTVPETYDELLDPEFITRLEQLELVSRKIFAGRMRGERRSKRRGTSVEFADYRNYVVGDDLRHIDWNIFGRLERLFLKLFLEEEDLHVYLLVDTSASMGFGDPTKLLYAKRVAAALAYIGLVNMDRVVLGTVGGSEDKFLRMQRGRTSMWTVLDFLAGAEPTGAGHLEPSLKRFVVEYPGKGIVVLLTDLLDKQGYETALRYLIGRQMDAYLIHLLSAEEVAPDLTGDLRLVDCEDDDTADVTISAPLLKRYKLALDAFCGQAREFCTRRGIMYIFTSNQRPFDQLVLAFLRERGLIK
jgi:uncharacterized protein (DUF58 family)